MALMNERYARRLERALELLGKGEIDEALDLAQQVYRKYPRDPYAQMIYGAVLWEEAEAWRGLELLERGLKRAPEEAFFRNLFRIYWYEALPSYALELAAWGEGEGFAADAELVAEARKVVESYGQPLEAVKAFDLLRWRFTHGEEVTPKAWQALVTRYPTFVEARNNLAVAAFSWGELETARDVNAEVLAQDPENWFARGLRWQLQQLLGSESTFEVDEAWFEVPLESSFQHLHLLTTALSVGAEARALELAEARPEGEDEDYELSSLVTRALAHAALNRGDEATAQRYAAHLPLPEGEPPLPTFPLNVLLPLQLYRHREKREALASYLRRYEKARAFAWAWLPFMLASEAGYLSALLLDAEEGAAERLRALVREPRGRDDARLAGLVQLVKRGEASLPAEVQYQGELREPPPFVRPAVRREVPLSPKLRRRLERALAAEGATEAAARLRALMRQDPRQPQFVLELANVLSLEKETRDEAKALLEGLLEHDPELLEARAHLVRLALYRYDFAAAWREIEAIRQAPQWPEHAYHELLEVQLRYALEAGFTEEVQLYGEALRGIADSPEALATSLFALIAAAREEMQQAWRQHPLPEGEALRLWLARYPEELLETTAEELFDAEPEALPERLTDPEELRELLVETPPHSRALLTALLAKGGRAARSELPEHLPSALNELERRLVVWVTPGEAVIPPPILRILQEVA